MVKKENKKDGNYYPSEIPNDDSDPEVQEKQRLKNEEYESKLEYNRQYNKKYYEKIRNGTAS